MTFFKRQGLKRLLKGIKGIPIINVGAILIENISLLQEIHKKVEIVDCTHWKEPKLIVKILLHFFLQHKNNIDLLFQLLRALCDRFIPDFQVI